MRRCSLALISESNDPKTGFLPSERNCTFIVEKPGFYCYRINTARTGAPSQSFNFSGRQIN
jgi:hypothetical protein